MEKRRRIVIYGNSVIMGALSATLLRSRRYDVISLRTADQDTLKRIAPDVVLFDLDAARPEAAFDLAERSHDLMLIGVRGDAGEGKVWSGRSLYDLSTRNLLQIIDQTDDRQLSRGGFKTCVRRPVDAARTGLETTCRPSKRGIDMKPSSIRRGSSITAVILAAAFVLAGTWPCAAQAPDPMPLDLGALPGHVFSQASAINSSGQIVGSSWGDDTSPDPVPFIWQKGVMTQLPLPSGYTLGAAWSINDSGQVAGYCGDGTTFRACVWTLKRKGWGVTTLDLPSEACPSNDSCFGSAATRINGAGQVLVTTASADWGFYAAIWQNGAWTVLAVGVQDGVTMALRLGQLPSKMNEKGQVLLEVENPDEESFDLWLWDNGPVAVPLAAAVDWANLNNSGQIVGRRFIVNSGPLTPEADKVPQNFTYDISSNTLTFSPESDAGYALVSINDSGQVLTATYDSLSKTTALGLTSFAGWDPGAVWASLGSAAGNVDKVTLKFNARGDVSGHATEGGAFFASAEAGVVPLNDLVTDIQSNVTGVTAMNDSGMVVGHQGGRTLDTAFDSAVLWSPGLWSTDLNVGTATVSVKLRTVTVIVPITNANQALTAVNVTINTATLDGGTLTTSLPLAVKSIAPGATVPVTLKFSASSLSPQPWELKVEGTSSLGAFSGTQTVTVK